MGRRNVGRGLNFGHIQDSHIGLPLMETTKWIVVGIEVFRDGAVASNGVVEHSAEGDTVDRAVMQFKPNDLARVLIHDDQYPLVRNPADSQRKRSKLQRLSFRCPRKVSQEGPPGVRLGWVMRRQDAANDLLIEREAERRLGGRPACLLLAPSLGSFRLKRLTKALVKAGADANPYSLSLRRHDLVPSTDNPRNNRST